MTRDEAKKLGKGHQVIFKSGDRQSKDFVEAKAVLVTKFWLTCLIEITEILQKGSANKTKPGDKEIVAYERLEFEPKKKEA